MTVCISCGPIMCIILGKGAARCLECQCAGCACAGIEGIKYSPLTACSTLATCFLLFTVITSCVATDSAVSTHAGVYSHAQCTAPLLDEQPASHYRGYWGPREFFAARTKQRVCLYSNVCLQLVEADSGRFSVQPQYFVPAPASAESSKKLPDQYLGFERFEHAGLDFLFDVHHEAVPADYAWAVDAGMCSCARCS